MKFLLPKRAIRGLLKGLGYQMVRIAPLSESGLGLNQESRVRSLLLRTAIRWLSVSLGYRPLRIRPISEPSFDMDSEFTPIYQATRPYAVSSLANMYTLYEAVQYVVKHDVPGDFVECGIYRGGSSMVAAHTLLAAGSTSRRLYLYDTFAGMSEPGKRDVRSVDGYKAHPGWQLLQRENINESMYSPLSESTENLNSTGYPEDKFVFVKGNVEDTIPDLVPDSIAILRLDTDFYDSTYHELVHLFPLLSPGGVLIIQGYGSWAGCREATDIYFKETKSAILLHRVDDTARIAMKLGA